MDSFEINKIIASILLVALLIIGISKVSNIIFKVDKLESSAYKVDVQESEAKKVSGSTKEVKIIMLKKIHLIQSGNLILFLIYFSLKLYPRN